MIPRKCRFAAASVQRATTKKGRILTQDQGDITKRDSEENIGGTGVCKFRDGTRLFPGIPGNQKSPGILEKVKIFWNSGKTKTVV